MYHYLKVLKVLEVNSATNNPDLKDKLTKQGIVVDKSITLHNTTREEALSALTMLVF